MKTYEQLMTHYWGVIVPMAEAAGINPWECVRYDGRPTYERHPDWHGSSSRYTFALTVLEKTPIFHGMTVYSKKSGISTKVSDNQNMEVIKSDWTLTPPTKKRTFMLGDKELPCPIKTDEGFSVEINNKVFYYDKADDSYLVHHALVTILTTARDKE